LGEAISSASDPDSAVDVSLPFTCKKEFTHSIRFLNEKGPEEIQRNQFRLHQVRAIINHTTYYHWVLWAGICNNLSFTV